MTQVSNRAASLKRYRIDNFWCLGLTALKALEKFGAAARTDLVSG